jgi:hypothetical protein
LLELKSLNLLNNDETKKKKKENDEQSILKKNRKKSTRTSLSLSSSSSLKTDSEIETTSQLNIIPIEANHLPLVTSVLHSSNYSVLLEPIRPDQNEFKSKKAANIENNFNNKDIFIDNTQTLDPFNDCELKTINDLEELKTILQNHQIDQQKQQQQQQQQDIFLNLLNNNNININNNNNNNVKICAVDSFGLPIVDLDINSNKIS